jgi:hypothetical protein
MSDSDSAPSNNSNPGTGDTPVDTAPYMKKKADNSSDNTHGYFIPAVMVLVLGVIIIATFYSKEFNNFITAILPSDHDEQLVAEQPGESDTIENKEHMAESASLVTASSAATETTSMEQITEKATPADNSPASIQDRTGFQKPVEMYAPPLAYAPPPAAYAMPGEWKSYNELMEQRRRAHEEAWRQHMQRIHEYQQAVMKRIEQDRADMYRYMQELARESQRRRDEFMNRMEHIEKASMDRPI